jgi:quercetin dioxygenase-like cupin family protein
MRSWNTADLDGSPHKPQILSSTDDARAIVIDLPAGESLADHEVHERAFLVLVSGEVAVSSAADPGSEVAGGPGLLVEFDPSERHRVDARSDARLLLLLTPWPGDGHPGAMSVEDKQHVRERAAERNTAQ